MKPERTVAVRASGAHTDTSLSFWGFAEVVRISYRFTDIQETKRIYSATSASTKLPDFVLGHCKNSCARTNHGVFVLGLSENACARTNQGVFVLGLSLCRVRKHSVYDILVQFEDISDLPARGVVFLMHLSGHLYPFFGSQLRRILHTIHPDT